MPHASQDVVITDDSESLPRDTLHHLPVLNHDNKNKGSGTVEVGLQHYSRGRSTAVADAVTFRDVALFPKEQAPGTIVNVKDRTKHMHALSEIPFSRTQELSKMENYYVSVSDPLDSTVQVLMQAHSCYGLLYEWTRNLSLQVLLGLTYLFTCVMVTIQCFGGDGRTCWFTLFVMCVSCIEMTVLFGFQRLARLLLRNPCWRIAELLVVWGGLILECAALRLYAGGGSIVSSGFWELAWIRLVVWFAHGRTRYEQFLYGLRYNCSGSRRRYRAEGFDLDYTYVHRNIVAMAWPAQDFEQLFRNPMEDVVSLLDRKHLNSYLVLNLCSERTYASSFFHTHVSWYPMDDHNPAELEMMLAFCHEVSDFIAGDRYTRLAVVHCKGGKGRTGTLICAYLMYSGLKRSADAALAHFAHLRTKIGASRFQGVQTPSQERYVRYFESFLRLPNLLVPRRVLRVRLLLLENIPPLWYTQDVGKLWFAILEKPCTERRVVFVSNPHVTFSSKLPDPSTYTAKQLRSLFGKDDYNLYEECNEMDLDPPHADANGSDPGPGNHVYPLDTRSFWFYVNHDYDHKLEHAELNAWLSAQLSHEGGTSRRRVNPLSAHTLKVSMELRDPNTIPCLCGDVVFKFFFARNNPNPLEPPVQYWIHTSFETAGTICFSRDKLDGPPKDEKVERYPLDFSITLGLESLSLTERE